jgi:hypothetical protein
MEELRREMLLMELRQRIREVRQGPDGLLCLITDEKEALCCGSNQRTDGKKYVGRGFSPALIAGPKGPAYVPL